MKNKLTHIILIFCLIIISCQSSHNVSREEILNKIPDRKWWKEAVIYQVYPRSFMDSNGDGIGDLKGINEKLDYIQSLGVNAVWLNPIYASPNDDNGYDISDYESIMKEFGTMADFDTLLCGLHKRGIKLILDLVVNHTSDEHKWFQESRKSRNNLYRNFYHWWPAERGIPPQRFSFFDETGSAWMFDSLTNAYYLHYFSRKQPDLKWENPEVRKNVYNLMRFWFDKGIDGFRMDVIPFISKDTAFPIITSKILTEKYDNDWSRYYAKGPNLHTYLKEMHQEVLIKYKDVLALGEGAGVTIDDAHKFVDEDRKELDMFFQFEAIVLGYSPAGYKQPDPKGWNLVDFKRVYSKWSYAFEKNGWGSIFLGNHDQPRMVSRWGNDSPQYHDYSSKLLHTFLLSMRSTPFIYNGDEIGMTNIRFDSIKDYRDIETISMYKNLKSKGINTQKYMEGWKLLARDNGRTPFQWDTLQNAGFTTGTPWIKINSNYKKINEEVEEKDSSSVLNYFRKMVEVRRNYPALIYGTYELLLPDDPKIYAYTRTLKDQQLLVVLNFSDSDADFRLADDVDKSPVLINNYKEFQMNEKTIKLKPYQAIIMKLH